MTLERRTLLLGLAGAAGCSAIGARGASGAESGESVEEIEQHGVTWRFFEPRPTGRYVNGDWWVEGPVEIVSISPRSESGERTRNGAMVNPDGGPTTQGYDSAMYGERAGSRYRPELNAALDVSSDAPLALPPGSSLISSISDRAPGARPQLRSAAVLTVVDAAPPADAFRPPYCGADKTPRWLASQLAVDRLARLEPAAGAPSPRRMTEQLARPWIDHVSGWMGRDLHPSENMPDYGREIARDIGDAALLLNCDIRQDRKMELLIPFVQLGIDLYGVARTGGRWPPDGGHASGRKLPILAAGALLGDLDMLDTAETGVFGEDAQTFYVEGSADGPANGGHGGYGPDLVGLPEWGIRHAEDPSRDDVSWQARYRSCCTANAWVGIVLAAHAMGLREAWNHDALFDYQDRFMATPQRESWRRALSPWAGRMWDLHRGSFPPIWSAQRFSKGH